MKTNDEKLFLTTFLDYLNGNFEYCILRNYEKYPQKIGNDIDILIKSANIDNIINKLKKYFKQNGLLYKIKTKNKTFLSIICFYESKENTIESVQLDIWTKLLWRGIEWIDVDYVLNKKIKYKDFYVPCNGCEAAITTFKELVANGIVKEKYYESLTNKVNNDKDSFVESLYKSFGKYSDKICELICNHNYEELNKQQSKIRTKLILRAPIRYIGNSLVKIGKKILNLFVPKGKLVAFIGPDGSGKTTFIDLSEKHFEKLYSGVKKYHIRFGILPELKTGRGISSMKGKVTKASNEKIKRSFISKVASWVVVLYYTLDFFLGRIPIRYHKTKNNLIFFDRYYYDFFVQPTSRHLIYKFRHILLFFVKKPNLIIHLDASAENVYKRKQELSIEEIKTQNSILKKLLKGKKNVFTVKTDDKSIPEIDREIFNILYKGL